MTSKQIADQIETIRRATEKARSSPEATVRFLHEAGIISDADVAARRAKNNGGAHISQRNQQSGAAIAVSSSPVQAKSTLSRAGHVAAKKSK